MHFHRSTASSPRTLSLSVIGFAAALLVLAAQLIHSPAPAQEIGRAHV